MFSGIAIANGNEKFYRDFVMPAFRWIDAERAHVLAVKAAAWGLVPRSKYKDPPLLVLIIDHRFLMPSAESQKGVNSFTLK